MNPIEAWTWYIGVPIAALFACWAALRIVIQWRTDKQLERDTKLMSDERLDRMRRRGF